MPFDFLEKMVNDNASGTSRSSTQGNRVLQVKYKSWNGKWFVEGRTADFGSYNTKKQAISRARSVYNSKDLYGGVAVFNKNGSLSTSQSFGDYSGI